jgi:DegV family protein with EDD domain
MKKISDSADSIFTLNELRYLVHGGRVSHIKSLLGSVLNIKPIIGVEKVKGTYVQLGQAWTSEQAVEGLVNQVARQYSPGISLRAQVVHGQNLEGAQMLHDLVDKRYRCTWFPTCSISPVLGAHTGPSVVGMAYAPESLFEGMP